MLPVLHLDTSHKVYHQPPINDTNLPDKYAASDGNYGHVTKGAAYALRGQVYLWLKKWQEAASVFKDYETRGAEFRDVSEHTGKKASCEVMGIVTINRKNGS